MNEVLEFVQDLVRAFPELEPSYLEHVQDNGEVLPHVFMGDVSRWIENKFSLEGASTSLLSILSYMESEFRRGDSKIQELIHVSLLENIYDLQVRGVQIADYFGDGLKHQVKLISPSFKFGRELS